MSDKTSPLKFRSIAELQHLSPEELASSLDLIPTERQRLYKVMYDKELRKEGVTASVGSDALEKLVLLSLLKQYEETALVPAGELWVKTARYVQERAKLNDGLLATETEPKARKRSALLPIAGMAVLIVCLALFLIARGWGKSPSVAIAGTLIVTRTPTSTPVNSPTPTPLALENQDQVIRGGDGGGERTVAYPVTLKVQFPGEEQPRVFVVQRRRVQTAEWDFDKNPDTASFINGLAVRPVLGIPWSPENASLFSRIVSGTQFILQMNTGALLPFEYTATSLVRRSDTSVFRQITPGLVLILIGERADDGQLTANRVVITAAYQSSLELSRDGLLAGVTPQPVASATLLPTPIDRVDVELVSVASHRPTKSVSIAVRIFNSRQSAITVGPDALWIALGYAPRPLGPRVPAEGLTPFTLLPGQAVNLTVKFPWTGEPYATIGTDGLGITGTYQFAIQLIPVAGN